MKRYIKSGVQPAFTLPKRYTINKNGQNYSIKRSGNSEYELSFSISELHPYDDAEYAWCRLNEGEETAVFYRAGQKLSEVTYMYEPERWMHDFDLYADDFIDACIYELRKLNKDVEPKMMKF